MALISSISFDQSEILKNILHLYVGTDRYDLDPTYSKGVFYKKLKPPIWKCDWNPQTDDTIKADYTNLPFSDNSLYSICFDPPFVLGVPNKSKDTPGSNLIKNRFGSFRTKKDLLVNYEQALKEFYRILKPGGYLVFKCQDTVSSGKQHAVHCDVYNLATSAVGYEVIDLFILLAKSRMTSTKWKRQVHARKYHSYFWVFQKRSDAA